MFDLERLLNLIGPISTSGLWEDGNIPSDTSTVWVKIVFNFLNVDACSKLCDIDDFIENKKCTPP